MKFNRAARGVAPGPLNQGGVERGQPMTQQHLHHLMYRAEAQAKVPLSEHQHHSAAIGEPPQRPLTPGFVIFLAGLPSALIGFAMRRALKA